MVQGPCRFKKKGRSAGQASDFQALPQQTRGRASAALRKPCLNQGIASGSENGRAAPRSISVAILLCVSGHGQRLTITTTCSAAVQNPDLLSMQTSVLCHTSAAARVVPRCAKFSPGCVMSLPPTHIGKNGQTVFGWQVKASRSPKKLRFPDFRRRDLFASGLGSGIPRHGEAHSS